ncbi:MAG: hypothetical protein ABSE59_07365 [Opitutaceae bacterium]|jgi:hypothetical protein
MTTPADTKPAPPAVVSYEEKLHSFWKKNRGGIFAVCAIVILAILAKGGWEIFNEQREKNVESAYAAATTPESLHDFAHNYQGHKLAGVASLRLADDEYAAGKYTEATADYEHAAEALAGTPFAGRIQLGEAICKIEAGRAADGEAQLRQLATDLTQLAAVRAEAAYDLASEAANAGRADEARQYIAQVEQIDQTGIWAQRAVGLQRNLAPEAGPGK